MKTYLSAVKFAACFLPLALVAFSSCSSERIEPERNLVEYEDATEYLETKKAQEQEYEITEESDGPLVCEQGTKIWLSNSLLMYPNGDSVDFPYTIKVVELYTPADYIYYQMPSVSGSVLLSTLGEIRVRAYKDNVELVLRPEKTWRIEVPSDEDINDLLCYYGNAAESKVNWTNLHQTPFDSVAEGYQADAKAIGWLACSKDAIGPAETTTIGFYSDSISLSNLQIFIYLPGVNGITQVSGTSSIPLPVDETARIIVIGRQGEQLYGFHEEIETAPENKIEVSLVPMSDAELTALLNAL